MAKRVLAILFASAAIGAAQSITADISGVRPGPIQVSSDAGALRVRWPDERGRSWTATFSLDIKEPLISTVAVEDRVVITGGRPFYRCETGRRRGGWDNFFDFPPGAPEGTRSFFAEFKPSKATARSQGERVELSFDGLQAGIFSGALRYIFYPGSRLIEQQAAMTTREPDVAYFYDAGLRMAEAADLTPGGTMNSEVSYYDPTGSFQTFVPPYGSERRPLAVRYRAIAARTGAGSVAVFPPPHRYMFARDYTTNMGYVWYKAWRGNVSLGIRQLPDDDTSFYPWMNAPPGTEQQMQLFILVDDGRAHSTLDYVARYTHADKFEKLPGYITFAPHWHLAYTMQARDRNFDWEPPFKPAMKAAGIDAAMIMDYHGDGHPRDTGTLRIEELRDYVRACRVQSDKGFLIIPAEEANVHLGGHWALVFPKPVYWHMERSADRPFIEKAASFGTVYNTANAKEVWDMVKRENGYVYQTHPRTKGSTGYPDAIKDTDYFRDSRWLGAGWKAMPSDLSSPRLGERAFKTIDDMNNLGLHKRMLGEVDTFQLEPSHELYAHLNINYVRLPHLPAYDDYGRILDAVAGGEYFTSTGEITIPNVMLRGSGDEVRASGTVAYTFPLRMAEIVWGDGKETHRQAIPLEDTREFGRRECSWTARAPNWTWARLAIWDVAGNGAFTEPIWRDQQNTPDRASR